MRVLLNKEIEPLLVDSRQSAGGLGHDIGKMRTIVDQRHLADERSFCRGLDKIIAEPNIHFPFQ
jgi:hypothetical protein